MAKLTWKEIHQSFFTFLDKCFNWSSFSFSRKPSQNRWEPSVEQVAKNTGQAKEVFGFYSQKGLLWPSSLTLLHTTSHGVSSSNSCSQSQMTYGWTRTHPIFIYNFSDEVSLSFGNQVQSLMITFKNILPLNTCFLILSGTNTHLTCTHTQSLSCTHTHARIPSLYPWQPQWHSMTCLLICVPVQLLLLFKTHPRSRICFLEGKENWWPLVNPSLALLGHSPTSWICFMSQSSFLLPVCCETLCCPIVFSCWRDFQPLWK